MHRVADNAMQRRSCHIKDQYCKVLDGATLVVATLVIDELEFIENILHLGPYASEIIVEDVAALPVTLKLGATASSNSILISGSIVVAGIVETGRAEVPFAVVVPFCQVVHKEGVRPGDVIIIDDVSIGCEGATLGIAPQTDAGLGIEMNVLIFKVPIPITFTVLRCNAVVTPCESLRPG